MKTEKILIIALIFLFSISLAHAVTLTTSLDKDVYKPNDKIMAASVITNDGATANFKFKGRLTTDIPGISMPRYYEESFQLEAGASKTINFEIGVVSGMYDGYYQVLTEILDAEYTTLADDADDLKVSGADKAMKLSLSVCKDKACSEETKVFTQGEDVYLAYSTNAESPSIKAELILPDSTTQTVSLPILLNAEKFGTYTLKLTASKSGYETAVKSVTFGVIEKKAVIEDVSECNANNVCENGETLENCPQDCTKESTVPKEEKEAPEEELEAEEKVKAVITPQLEVEEESSSFWLWALVILVIIVIIIFAAMHHKSRL